MKGFHICVHSQKLLRSALSGTKWFLDDVFLLDREGFGFCVALQDCWKEAAKEMQELVLSVCYNAFMAFFLAYPVLSPAEHLNQFCAFLAKYSKITEWLGLERILKTIKFQPFP